MKNLNLIHIFETKSLYNTSLIMFYNELLQDHRMRKVLYKDKLINYIDHFQLNIQRSRFSWIVYNTNTMIRRYIINEKLKTYF
jgi:hypothetical protein